jgi:hypothetical protein
MAKCSIRYCNDTAIAGFAEIVEESGAASPRRTVPAQTRYWCRRHACLALETQGKRGRRFDLTAPELSTSLASKPPAGDPASLRSIPGRSEAPRNHERRGQERFRADGLAEVVANSKVLFRGETHDISRGGCYIKSKGYLSADVGEAVEVRFSVSGIHFRASAKVRSVRRGKGAGLEFLSVEEDAQNNLNTLLERLAFAQPEPSAPLS